jgi:hypothetical protein
MPEDRRHVAIGVEHHRGDTSVSARPAPQMRARGRKAIISGNKRPDQCGPAKRVVQEGGAREVPAVLLVHEQRRPGDRERER